MVAIAEVQLDFIGHTEEADGELWQDFLACLHMEPGLSGAPIVRTSSTGLEVVALVVTLRSAHALRALASTLLTWVKTRRGDITVKLSASGRTAELRAGVGITEIERVLQTLVTPITTDTVSARNSFQGITNIATVNITSHHLSDLAGI